MKKDKKILIAIIAIIMIGTMATTPIFAYSNKDFVKTNKIKQKINNLKSDKIIGKVININGYDITIKTNKNNSIYVVKAETSTLNKFIPISEGLKPEEVLINISDIKLNNTLIIEGDIQGKTIIAKTITNGSLGRNRIYK